MLGSGKAKRQEMPKAYESRHGDHLRCNRSDMNQKLSDDRPTLADSQSGNIADKLRRSRQRLLDLTLRNRLLNFRPGNPDYRDDLKAHKHAVLKGSIESAWQQLVDNEKPVEIVGLTLEQQEQIARELQAQRNLEFNATPSASTALATIDQEQWDDIRGTVRGISQIVQRGDLISLLPEEAFQKRLTKIRNERNTLENSTGDSALFLAIGFLKWCEPPPHPKAGEPLFAPLIMVHVHLDQCKIVEGGVRKFVLQMDVDQPQGNPCLAEKLRQDFAIDLPELDEDEAPNSYFSRVSRALKTQKHWEVSNTIALGFFNFARYRLWLDLNPEEWPVGTAPTDHPIISSILNATPLPQGGGVPSDEEVATHQETDDLPIVLDSDSTQYAALLAAQNGVSLVIQGPPGSGKSQTITNLIAVALQQGKRVLFVAQKLPALQVVQRRLEAVELAAFCLPLFSDKARVTEMHKHLATSVRLRESPDWRRGLDNPVAPLAKKLNAHATRLREHPVGFDQTTCAVIQQATAVHLMLRDAWGDLWDDELLEISTPDTAPSVEWLERRDRTIYQWHRLKVEVGQTWSQWTPLKLGAMDTPRVEAVVRQQQQSAVSLADEFMLLPDDYHSLTIAKIEQLVNQVSKGRLTVLRDVLPKLLEYLWSSPDSMPAVARLEREIEEFHRHLSKAQRHLRFAADNQSYVAGRVSDALGTVVSVLSPRCSITSAKVSLEGLNDVLRWADDLLAYARTNPSGVPRLLPDDQPTEQSEIAWKHIEILGNHQLNSELHIPDDGKLLVARYVLDDGVKHGEARAFAQRLARYNASVARLSARVTDPSRLSDAVVGNALDESTRCLCQHSLGEVQLCRLLDLKQGLSHLAQLIHDATDKTPADLSVDVFTKPTLNISDYRLFAVLAELPVKLFEVPQNGADHIVARLVGKTNHAGTLQDFSAAVRSYQTCSQELRSWFPDIQLGQPLTGNFLSAQREAARIVQELGLLNHTLESISQLADKVERLRKAMQTAIAAFKDYFEGWPLLPPESLDQLREAKKLVLFLLDRPQAPAEVSIEALCLEKNTDIVSDAIADCRTLQEFRAKRVDQVLFKDLPDAETIAIQRRELRAFDGCWWRWCSSRYHRTRKTIRSFLTSPFPSDKETVPLLDSLEAHQKQCVAFRGSPAGAVLGGLFNGIETKWQAIEPTLKWISELKVATQASDVTPFVQSALRNAERLRAEVKALEILGQLIEHSRGDLAKISSLSLLSAEPRTVKLPELVVALCRTETLLKQLVEHTQGTARLKPTALGAQLVAQIDHLEHLQQLTLALRQYSAIAEPVVSASLRIEDLDESAKWLAELTNHNVAPRIIDAIITKKLEATRHAPLFGAAAACIAQLNKLTAEFVTKGPASWLGSDVSWPTLALTVESLVPASTATHTHALGLTFNSQLTILEVSEALADVHEIETGQKAFVFWKDILREDPSLIVPAQITTSLDWLDSLRLCGAKGRLLEWLLADEVDNRIHWWQELVNRATDLRARVRKLQESYVLPLYESQSLEALAIWTSQTANRSAQTTSALEVIESHSQSSDFTIFDLNQATASLRRAIELAATLQDWQERIGVDPTQIAAERIHSHRQWFTIVRGLSPVLGLWLISDATTTRCETLLGLESKLSELKALLKRTENALESFGRTSGDGPYDILSTKGTLQDVEHRCHALIEKIPLLPNYAALLREQETAKELGLGKIIKHSRNGETPATLLVDTFRGAVTYQQAKAIWESDDELRYFQSSEHERLRQKFQSDDAKQLKTNRRFVHRGLARLDVTEGEKGRTVGEHTEYALLKHEMGKQRRHIPIRRLVHRAGRAMQDLCPCWMMTPLAVAQFLPPGAITFDLVIMDEASQINPEDAWGATARGTQLVVVGDQKQMPPSDFFESALEEDESPDDDMEIDGGKSESILDASVASLQSCSLLWHYRSRQETLIAPANSFSYDNRLVLFPHPHRNHPELGIRYRYIDNATTTIGKVINALEAEAVALRVRELVLREYAKPATERLSIGVVTMNLHQQDCIMDLLEQYRQEDRRFDFAMAALAAGKIEEPLFVRNLENIQGDERDIMIISCTYGPHTPGGTPTQRFGPLNREGGERRFNVLITRAKWRMEVFSSIRSDQILTDGKRQGVRDFHLFLKYAESGILSDQGAPTGRPPDSPFEIQVEAVLTRSGFAVERQVGVAGYFIDLAVKHPHHPGLFALGIECDGATYHSSRAARDRDRLREQVLKERGWKLHRIWSTDWFVNPLQAKAKLIEAVSHACQ